MRLLYVGHAYLVAENRKKLRALAQLPGVEEVRLVVPHRWPATMHGDLPYDPLDENLFRVLPLRSFLAGHEMLYGYWNAGRAFAPCPLPAAPDLICVEQGAGAFALFQFLLARNRYAPKANVVFFTWWNLPYRSRQPLRALERFNLKHSNGGIAGNAEARDILREHGFRGPLTVIPQLGVDEEVFCRADASALRAELGLGSFVVGYVGRFVPEKGLRVLADAAIGLDMPLGLLLLGNGPLENEMRQRLAPHPKVKLRVLHSIPHADVARYLNAMDVMVLPSLTTTFWKEQFGHVLIEAFACETPVVGSTSAEVPNVVGDAGIITPEGDARALCAALLALAHNPALRLELGHKGRQRALTHFTNRRIAERNYEFFKELL